LNSQSFKRFFSPSWLLQQKTMITIENGIVAGDLPLCIWLRGNFSAFCVLHTASQRTVNRTGSEMKCAQLCDFHFCCTFFFCQPMKKFEFFGASRATRQRHFMTSSTGDENASASSNRILERLQWTYFNRLLFTRNRFACVYVLRSLVTIRLGCKKNLCRSKKLGVPPIHSYMLSFFSLVLPLTKEKGHSLFNIFFKDIHRFHKTATFASVSVWKQVLSCHVTSPYLTTRWQGLSVAN